MIKLIKFINNFWTNLKAELARGKYERSKSRIDKYRVDSNILNEESQYIQNYRDITRLKRDVNLDKQIIKSGKRILKLAFVTFLGSWGLSIAGGYTVINDLFPFLCYCVVLTTCQVTIYLTSYYNTMIKTKFNRHYPGIKLIQLAMLFVSISMNIMFFHANFESYLIDAIMLPLCISLDYSTLLFSTLGHDKVTLNFDNKALENKSLILMFLDNLTYSLRGRIINTYKNNNLSKDVQEISKDVPNMFSDVPMLSNGVQIIPKDVSNISKDIERFLEINFKGKILTGEDIKIIFNEFELTDFKWRKIKPEISNIEIIGKRTKVI